METLFLKSSVNYKNLLVLCRSYPTINYLCAIFVGCQDISEVPLIFIIMECAVFKFNLGYPKKQFIVFSNVWEVQHMH